MTWNIVAFSCITATFAKYSIFTGVGPKQENIGVLLLI